MRKEINRVRLPDVSGDIYERDEHYWQDVTTRYDVTYEDGMFIPAKYSKALSEKQKKNPSPYYLTHRLFADKYNMVVLKKTWTEQESSTTTYDLGPVVPPVPPTTAPIISKSHYQFWYGSVNCWAAKVNGHYPFEAQIPELVKIGCTGYHIEMFGWKGGTSSDAEMTTIRDAYAKLVTLCRQNKMWLFVDVINGNWNGPNTKWTAGVTNYDKLYVGYIVDHYGQTMINIIKDNGPQNVIVQPIGEPGSKGQVDDCHRFQNMCVTQLSDYILVTEPGRNNSSKMTSATQYSTIHVSNDVTPLDENDKLVKGGNDGVGEWSSSSNCDIVVSDTGTAIQVLASPEPGSQQGWLNKWTSACSRASRLVNYVRNYKGKCAVVVYYHFKFKCMGTNGSTVDGELAKGTWDDIKSIVNPKYPST